MIAASTLGLSSSLFYLAVYGFTTIGAFAVVTLVRDATGEAAHLRRWAGLGKRSPLVAGIFAFFLLAFAGIPLTSGFTGKFAVFQAAIAGGALPLVIVGVLASAVAAFFYVRVIVLMFFSDPAPDGPSVVTPGLFTGAAVAIGAVTTLVFGVVPQPLLNLSQAPEAIAWRERPSTYVVCTDDMAVHPDLQRLLARRCTNALEWPTSHSPFLSRPDLVAGLVSDLAHHP